MSAMHRLTGRATCSQHQVCLTNSRHTSAISTARISDSRHRTAQHQQHALGQDTLDFSKKIRTAQPGSQLAVKRRDVLGLGALAAVTLLVAEVPSLTLPSATHAAPSTQLRSLSSEEQAAVDKALKAISKTKAPVALRLVFHDAGTYRVSSGDGGANASIRMELDRPENFGLKRGWSIIKQLSDSLKGTPAAVLSYADLIALAGAQAVVVCAGPRIPVRVGRQDAAVADPIGRLPAETLSAQQQKDMFAAMGISTREFMALMGSHTIGNKGFGAPDKFDNVYYDSLLKRPWTNTKDEMASMIGLPSDHVLPDDPELAPIIEEYARDEAAFLRDFTAAYIKLTELGA